jgi:hypothetical protein
VPLRVALHKIATQLRIDVASVALSDLHLSSRHRRVSRKGRSRIDIAYATRARTLHALHFLKEI